MMKSSSQSHAHQSTSITVRLRASMLPYSCGFFCQRKTDSDVVEPKDTKPEDKKEPVKPKP